MATDHDGMIGIPAVAKMTGLSPKSISVYRSQGKIPAADGMSGQSPLWWPETIERWIADRMARGVERVQRKKWKKRPATFRVLPPESDDATWVDVEITGGVIRIDLEDLHILDRRSPLVTTIKGTSYATVLQDGKRKMLHSIITGAGKSRVSAVNGSFLDVRKTNLAVGGPGTNSMVPSSQTSRYRGVRFQQGSWSAKIGYRENLEYLGAFDTEVDAARAWDAAARKRFGPTAPRNLPDLPLLSDAQVDALRRRRGHSNRGSHDPHRGDTHGR